MRGLPLFRDRSAAGRRLGELLQAHAGAPDLLVLALPRGGVPVASEVAAALGAELDVFVVRKLGVPGHEELAMGAIASGGALVLNEHVLAYAGVTPGMLEAAVAREQVELGRRERLYRGDRPATPVAGRTVILVDDGLATGASMRAAATALRRLAPRRLIVAVPVAPAETCDELRELVDDVVCAHTPEPFYSVGSWYEDFAQTSDDEVHALLMPPPGAGAVPGPRAAIANPRAVRIPAGDVELDGDLVVPESATGMVVFAHGSGSSRHSRRNRQVAASLQQAGLATLLMDLLTRDEEERDAATAQWRFDIPLLADRLLAAIAWLEGAPGTAGLPIGCFGASTGGAAALVAAARRPDAVRAVVSRGGRPDLAGPALASVRAPTLLIVGGADTTVLAMNRAALAQLRCRVRLELVPGASHLFEEPGALEQVATRACDWFRQWLVPKPTG